MNDPHTPSTDEVRKAYIAHLEFCDPWPGGERWAAADFGGEFDRWLETVRNPPISGSSA